MRCWVLVVLVVVTATGCASSPKPAKIVTGAVSPVHNDERVVHRSLERLPLPPSTDPIRPVSHVTEPGDDPQGSLFGSTASVEELISFAVANNPEIQTLHMQAHALEARVPQVRGLDDPMLMTTTFLEPIQTAAGPQDVMMSISQKLPWFGKRTLRGDVVYHHAQATFARMAAAELSVIEQVKLAYYELYFIDRAIDVNEELKARIKDVIDIAKTKYETAGEKTGLETVLQAQVELGELEMMLVQLVQAKEKAKARLHRALHTPPGVSVELEPSLSETNVPRSAEVLVALIDQCQPKLDALRREMSRDQSAIALANKNYYPDVTMGFNWHAIGSTGLSPVTNGDDAYSLLVGVNLPIYKQKLDAGLREAEFQAARTAQQYEATWAEVRAEVQTLYAQAIEHDRIVRILDETILPKSKQTLELSIEAFRVDRITFQQLIENYETLLRHRLDYYRRVSQRAQTLAAIERAVGCAITTWPTELEEVPSAAPRR